MKGSTHFLQPQWPVPDTVRAYSSLRTGGVSRPPYDSLNLAQHVGDDANAVSENRTRLQRYLDLPSEPIWLQQVHGNRVLVAEQASPVYEADAAVTSTPESVLVVLTADCLPILLADRHARRIAVAHGGWRGLARGVLDSTVAAIDLPPGELVAWIGPGIGARAFEVGEEVRAAFVEEDRDAERAFAPSPTGRWLADLAMLARRRLVSLGVRAIDDSGLCTYSEPQRFFSYRRDGQCGRMATVIWLQP